MIHPSADRIRTAALWILAGAGALLLAVGMVVELSDLPPQVQLWTGAVSSGTFLLATTLRRGGDVPALTVRARLLLAASLAALLSVVGLWQATERAEPKVLLLLVPVGLLFGTAALAVREAGTTGREARRRELRSRLAGEEAERRHWVRELHDDTLQDLAAVEMVLAAAGAARDPDAVQAGITDARTMINHQIQALRRLIAQMRPLSLDALGLSAALADLARRIADLTGLEVVTDIDALPRLPAEVETSTYRIVQEALTNAARHSGAGRVSVSARTHRDRVELAVTDDGHGFAAGPGVPAPPPAGAATGPAGHSTDRPGYGLIGMYERSEALGATLTITSDARGTLVRLSVPRRDPVPPPGPATGAGRMR